MLHQTKEEKLRWLMAELDKCDSCPLCSGAKHKVLGEGNLDSPIVLVGEAPGRKEDETGRPFVGSAGKLLTGLLTGVGLSRKEVFISNVVRCRPPGNRRPRREEVEACSDHLETLLEIIKPRVIAPMGNSSIEYFFEKYGLGKAVIGDVHGKPRRVAEKWGEIVLFPLYHPAAAIYNRRLLKELEGDVAFLAKLLLL